jgi:hypothetical protein
MATLSIPQELFSLIIDILGKAFVDPESPDYQGPPLRTALYSLSLSHPRRASNCRRYLWHTLSLRTEIPDKGKALPAIPGYQELHETLSSDNSPEPLIRRLRLQWEYSVLALRGRRSRVVSKRATEEYTNA